MLSEIQQSIETLYHLEPLADVAGFLIDRVGRDLLVGESTAREQLLVFQNGLEDAEVALFLDDQTIESLAKRTGNHIEAEVLQDFLLALEGISHLVYFGHCATQFRSVSQLELEVQAEVDKYTACLLNYYGPWNTSQSLRQTLFKNVVYDEYLDQEKAGRYRKANTIASRYSRYLEKRFLRKREPRRKLLSELREFYRAPLRDKILLSNRDVAIV